MVKLHENGVFLIDGKPCVQANISSDEARKGTITYKVLQAHNVSGDDKKLNIKFDALVSHDITYVGIIQSARVGGLKEFPVTICR